MTRQGADRVAHRTILGPDQIDHLGEAVIALTREIWVLTDRLAIVEAVLTERGIDMAAVDRYQPDAALTARLDAKRQALIDQVLAALRVDTGPS